MSERSNAQWLCALEDPDERDAALDDLHKILLRGLHAALDKRPNLREEDLEDFVQDALLKILDNLDTFRGESRFTTWAQKIGVRVALTELRRRRWQEKSLDDLVENSGSSGTLLMSKYFADPAAGPEQQALQSTLLTTLRQVIDEKLTERQRQAMVAVRIHGMPLEEVARSMDTNRNALYKLLHDGRQRLQTELLSVGLTSEEILHAFEN